MVEITRYRLMPVSFDSRQTALDPVSPEWDPDVQAQHEANQAQLVERLRHVHGDANLEIVMANMVDLGSDPWSSMGWHLHLWSEVRHAFVSGAYYPAVTGAGALGERVLNHILFDLCEDCATLKQRTEIHSAKPPMFHRSLEILNLWGVLEDDAAEHFAELREMRNALVHYRPGLYDELRDRSLAAVTTLRDALNAQFGVFVRRRLIEGTPGLLFLKQAVVDEPSVTRYLVPMAFKVSPKDELTYDEDTHYWRVATDNPVNSLGNTDEEFVRLLRA